MVSRKIANSKSSKDFDQNNHIIEVPQSNKFYQTPNNMRQNIKHIVKSLLIAVVVAIVLIGFILTVNSFTDRGVVMAPAKNPTDSSLEVSANATLNEESNS